MPCRPLGPWPSSLVALVLLGCQAAPPADKSAPPAPAAPAVAPSAGPTAPASPALAFVAAARPGQRATVSDPTFGGTIVVEIEAQYHSASNRICRRFAVSRPAPPLRRQTKFACFTATGLKLVDIY